MLLTIAFLIQFISSVLQSWQSIIEVIFIFASGTFIYCSWTHSNVATTNTEAEFIARSTHYFGRISYIYFTKRIWIQAFLLFFSFLFFSSLLLLFFVKESWPGRTLETKIPGLLLYFGVIPLPTQLDYLPTFVDIILTTVYSSYKEVQHGIMYIYIYIYFFFFTCFHTLLLLQSWTSSIVLCIKWHGHAVNGFMHIISYFISSVYCNESGICRLYLLSRSKYFIYISCFVRRFINKACKIWTMKGWDKIIRMV